jgi:hypothetical protein
MSPLRRPVARCCLATFSPSSCSTLWSFLPFWSIGVISQFLDHLQTVRLLRRAISSSQGLYLYTGQHKHRKTHTHTPNIHALSGIRTHDPGFRASEDSTCLRPLSLAIINVYSENHKKLKNNYICRVFNGKINRICNNRLWGSPSHISTDIRNSFPGVKQLGREADTSLYYGGQERWS